MERYKFRGKDKTTGKWVEGFYVCIGEKYSYIFTGKIDFRTSLLTPKSAVIPETVGQNTGMKDKKGTEIYEGDIIEVEDELVWGYNTEGGMEYDSCECRSRFIIGYDESEAAFRITGSNLRDYEEDSQFLYDIDTNGNGENIVKEVECRATVIGNIHDNPELLEQKEQEE